MCGADIYCMDYLCSCSCCSKLRGDSLQKSWQLAGLLAKTPALWAQERLVLMTVFRIIAMVTNYKQFHCIMADVITLKFPNDITECYAKWPFGLIRHVCNRHKLV